MIASRFSRYGFARTVPPTRPPARPHPAREQFNNLNISVRPKAGRMLLWSHVKNSNVESMDGRTEHEAMPVIKGTKMAANAWVHLYEFRKYNALGCTG